MRVEPDSTRFDEPIDLFEHEPCGHVVTDMDGLILRANAMFATMTGHPVEELVGSRRLHDLLSPAGRIYYETHLRPMLHMQGFLREIAVELTQAAGDTMPVLINSRVRFDEDGCPAAVQTIVLDATERRAYERELLVTSRRIERLQRVAAVFATALSSEQIARETLDEIVDGVKADSGLLAVLDAGHEGLVLVSVSPGDEDVPGAWHDLRVDAVEPIERAIRREEPQFIEGSDGTDRGVPPLPSAGPTSTRLAILPLTADDRTFGVLCLASSSLATFDRDEQLFLVSFAQLVAQALERGRLLRAERQAAERALFLSTLSRSLDEAVQLAERAQRVVDMLVPGHADFATIEIPALGPRPIAARHRDPELLETLLDLRERASVPESEPHSLARAGATGEPQLLREISDELYARYARDDDHLSLLRRLAPRSYLGLPLRARGEVVGSLLLAMAGSARRFTDDDVPFYVEISDRAALSLENARLLDYEREVAQSLQRSLLPASLPGDTGLGLGALYLPGTKRMQVGGDWFDVFSIPGGRLGAVVGDVVGHDIDAAAVMGQVRTALRALAVDGGGPAATLERLSRFADSVPGAYATTVAYAEVDVEGRTVRYACAGHLPPVVFGGAGDARPLWGGRFLPLGVEGGDRPPEGAAELGPDDALLLFTDGLIERRDRTIDAGLKSLLDLLRNLPPADPDLYIDRLAQGLLQGADQVDDVCILGVFPTHFAERRSPVGAAEDASSRRLG